MKFTEDIILKYLDGNLSDHEIHLFKEELKRNKPYASLYEKHKSVHEALLMDKLSTASASFSNRVMNSISSLEFEEVSFFNKSRLIVLTIVVLAVVTTLFYLSRQFYPSVGGALSNEINLQEFTLNLQPAQQILNSDILFKIVFYVNGLISLLLLDRAILKPYFIRRKQRYSL